MDVGGWGVSPEPLNRGAGASLPWVGAGWSHLPVLIDGWGGGPPSQLLRHLTASYGPPTLIHSHASADRGSCRVISDGRLDRRTQGWGGRGRGHGVREGVGTCLVGTWRVTREHPKTGNVAHVLQLGWSLTRPLGCKEEVLTGLTSTIASLRARSQIDVERHLSDLGASQGTGCMAGPPLVIQVSVDRTSPMCLAPSEPAPSLVGATHAPSRCRPAGWTPQGPAEGLPGGHQAPPAAQGVRLRDGLFSHGNSAIWKFNRIIHNL